MAGDLDDAKWQRFVPLPCPSRRFAVRTMPGLQRLTVKSCCHAAWAVMVLALACGVSGVGRAEWRETFETPETSWRLMQRDARSSEKEHTRTFQQARSGQGSEYLRVFADYGT